MIDYAQKLALYSGYYGKLNKNDSLTVLDKSKALYWFFFFQIKAFVMAQSGYEAASKSDVTSLDTKQDLDFDNDTLKGK